MREITEVAGGYDGLAVTTADGNTVVATGIGERMNLTAWLGRRGRAGSIADAIYAARDGAATAG